MRKFACLLIGSSLSFAQPPLPSAPGASIVDISSPARFSEPGIAVNSSDPNQVVAVYQGGAAVQGGSNVAYSRDGGHTFQMADDTKLTGWRVAGDVSTAFDNKGHAFLCYLAFDRLGTTSYWAHDAGRNGIFVRRSMDGGKTWEEAVSVKSFPTGHEADIQFEDEPRIFSDNGAKSPRAGNLYVGWVEWQMDKSIMLFSRSTDDGQTWSPPVRISTHAGLPRDDNGSLGGFVQAVGPDGEIYAVWDDGNKIVFARSHDGGKSFSSSKPILEVGPPYFGEVPGVSRVEGFPQIAIDPRGGKHGGNLYVTWSDYSNGDVDVFLATSSNRGKKWSKPVRVNDDPLHDGKDQFYQWMTVDPITGAVYVQFYDRRDDEHNRKTGFTLARSVDAGRMFTNYAWTKTTFESQGAFLGDYTWLAAFNDRVYGVWTETVQSDKKEAGPPKTIIRLGTANFSGVK